MNFFADFYKFFKCHLFYKNSRKSLWKWEIIETNNWIKLLIFDDKSLFFFLNLFLNNLFFRRCSWKFFFKPILKIIPQKWIIYEDFKDWIYALAEQMIQFNYHTLLVTPFKGTIDVISSSMSDLQRYHLNLSLRKCGNW